MSVKIYKLGAGATTLEVGLTAIKGGAIGRVLFEGSGSVLQESSNFFWDNTNSWLGIGTATPAYALDVNGTARVSSSLYAQSGIYIGGTSTAAGLFVQAGSITNRETIALRGGLLSTDAGVDIMLSNGQGDVTITSGTRIIAEVIRGFVPTSGTGVFNTFAIVPTINQTGGANGITRGLYINPTITAAADFRAIETTVGKVCLNTTSGNTMIGTTTDAGFKLDVNGTARVSGTTTITPATLTGIAATSALDISQTWNTTGTPIALKVNITDTASAALSDLISLQVGGAVRFRIVKTGFFAFNSSGEILGSTLIGGTTINTSSQLEVRSTTKGFLPPRMTTAEKNAIATPASGLVVYDTTLGKLCVRGASAWETITSV